MFYWLSSHAMTVGVETDKFGTITQAPPIVRKFIGQHVDNLTKWMHAQGGLKVEKVA